MNEIEALYKKSDSSSEYARLYLSHLSDIFDRLDLSVIEKFVDLLLEARKEAKTVFFVGNGGSAATASHFANDLATGTRSTNAPLRAISLTDNNSVMTAIANDFGYENLFTKQLESLYQQDDLLVAISASGNSDNVLRAVEFVNKKGGTTVGLTGFSGGKLMQLSKLVVHVPTDDKEYGPVEDIHMILDHMIGTYLMYAFREEG